MKPQIANTHTIANANENGGQKVTNRKQQTQTKLQQDMKVLKTNLQNTAPYWLVLQLNFIIVSQLIHNCK